MENQPIETAKEVAGKTIGRQGLFYITLIVCVEHWSGCKVHYRLLALFRDHYLAVFATARQAPRRSTQRIDRTTTFLAMGPTMHGPWRHCDR